MHVYSKKIVQFICTIKRSIKEILVQEIGLQVHGDRFYDQLKQASYPISIRIYNDRSLYGYFDPHFYEVGFHECLMHSSPKQLQDIIRHELAHYITFINYGADILSHGMEFKRFCKQMGWEDEVARATTCLDDGVHMAPSFESGILRKIQKLMALSTSCNEHESQQAMIKSQQLLLKHHMDAASLLVEDDERIFLKRILHQPKNDTKLRAIASILQTFFVTTVFSKTSACVFLEIAGNAENVEIADYVANFLKFELDRLWNLAKEQHQALKGLIAKNSFFLGVAKGYCDKIEFLKREYQSDLRQALMVIEGELARVQEMIYPHLSKSRTHGRYSQEAALIGQDMGKTLSINPAVTNSRNSGKYLT